MTSSHHGPYALGWQTSYNGRYRGPQSRKGELIPTKPVLSSDCGLQFARMKSESLVIADQHAAVNMFLSLVHTARQATRVGSTRSR